MSTAKPDAALLEPASNEVVSLAELHLDRENPRFADRLPAGATEEHILDLIVSTYGIDDVLSSIAMNGYFSSEPLVGVRKRRSDPISIVEGNRRLAACLILTGDPRGKNQSRRAAAYSGMPGTSIRELPVAVFRERSALLPYLGVRHIAGSKPWDGYAKASWIARVLEENANLTLQKVTDMTGDQHRTIARLVEGYYFVSQLIDAARFSPENSLKSGRGSNTAYPFSWTYTILGFKNIRDWLGMAAVGNKPNKTPVDPKRLDRAEILLDMMFGNRSRQFRPAISDSRELQDLAKTIADPKVLGLLRDGQSLRAALIETKSMGDKIDDGLNAAQRSLSRVQVAFGGGAPLSQNDARRVEPLSKEVRNRAADVYKQIVAAMTAEAE